MMEDNAHLEHLGRDDNHDLRVLFENSNYDPIEEEQIESPFELCKNTCMYYDPTQVRKLLIDMSSNLSMFCLNCQGLKPHWDSFYNLLQEMGNETCTFDVIGITEIFSVSKNECNLPGYHPLEFTTRHDSNNSRGGIGIYIKKLLPIQNQR